VTLANVPGGRAAVMVEVGDIDLSVKLLPLFTGHIALDKIMLDQPTIALEVDKDGNPNWKFGKATTSQTGETKKAGTLTLPASVSNWVGPGLPSQVRDTWEEIVQKRPHGDIPH